MEEATKILEKAYEEVRQSPFDHISKAYKNTPVNLWRHTQLKEVKEEHLKVWLDVINAIRNYP